MSLRLVAPACAPLPSLEDLRQQIDAVDDALLHLLQQRQLLASRARGSKGDGPRGLLALKPDREAHVLSRLMDRAAPEMRALVVSIWREVMSAGLAAQQAVEVVVWTGTRTDLGEATRARFGSACLHRRAETPGEALRAAAVGDAVAVLALSRDDPWWADLSAEHPDLWVFEALGPRGPRDPAALAVGRVDPASLTGSVAYQVSGGGDDAGSPRSTRRLLGVAGRARLYAVADADASDRAGGLLGRAPVLATGV